MSDKDLGDRTLPNGQILLLGMPQADEGRELLMSSDDRAREKYPLSTIEKDQERLQAILHLLAADAPLRFICRSYHVGWHTLESIREKQGTKIAAVKKVIARRMSTFVQLGVESLLDELAAGNLDPDKLGVTLGILVDKLQLLTGEATSIIEDKRPRLSADTLHEKLAAMKVAAPTGSVAADNFQTSPGAPGGPVLDLPSDSQSDNNLHK